MEFSSTRSEIVNDLDYQNAPESVDATVLEEWVAAYRAGDNTFKDRLVRAHLKVTKTTADNWCFKSRKYHLRVDLVQEAFMVMLKAVESAQTELNDNHITPYIVSAIQYRLNDYIARERTVSMPGRTFREKLANGKEIKGVSADSQFARNRTVQQGGMEWTTVTPTDVIAPPDDVSPEFAEAMSLAVVTDEERKVIDLRLAGFKYRDYEAVGYRRDKVNRIIKRVRSRFNRYYA